MKLPFALTFALVAVTSAHAQSAASTPQEVTDFLAHPTHCAVLVGGPDRVGDAADLGYSESLNKALSATGGPVPAAAEQMRNRCLQRLAQVRPQMGGAR